LVDDHSASKAALGGFAISVHVVVGPDFLVAVLLGVGVAWAAVSAASDDGSDSHGLSYSELGNIWSHLHHLTHHFVPVSTQIMSRVNKVEHKR
jgi:SNF family Na+-dependent transporter